jgi:indole-3-glycerol phosphate synthase
MFLERIVAEKRREIERLKEILPRESERPVEGPVISLSESIRKHPGELALIAEVKPASPSKGIIREQVDPVQVATAYQRGGANAVSVLTDRRFFSGEGASLKKVKKAVSLPVLRKDFILDPVQVMESRMLGADAILLIAALLDREQLEALSAEAHSFGMEVLVEIHREEEIERALACDPDVIGINNRDLITFVTDLGTTERLRPLLPDAIPVIGESGVSSPEDFRRMVRAGVDGVLVGEYLMRQPDPEQAVRTLIGGGAR